MNFVVFMPDQLRADCIGCYGHPLTRTPNMDRLAEDGARFDAAFTQHTICGPSRCSMMTGWYPHVSGHRTQNHLLRPHEPNLFKYLKQAGYEVHWCGKNDLLAAASFSDSVTSFGQHGSIWWGANPYPLDHPLFYTFLYEPWEGPVEEHHDAACVLNGIEFLKTRKADDAPFCLYLPLILPHPPYSACQPWHDMYSPDDVPPLRPAGLAKKPAIHELMRKVRRLDQCDEGLFRKVNAIYLGMTSLLDHILGWLLDALDETGLADHTTVLFLADHGDWAGDYGLVEKSYSAHDDCLTRVPFIIRTPGGQAGHVVREPVEILDLMATVLELAGIEPRHTHFSRSLVPQIRGAAGDPDRAVFIEGGLNMSEPHCFEGRDAWHHDPRNIYYPLGVIHRSHRQADCRATTIRTRTAKLTLRPDGVDELYDLEKDPRELNNVAGNPEYADLQRTLERRMLEWYVHTGDVVPFDEDPRNLPPH